MPLCYINIYIYRLDTIMQIAWWHLNTFMSNIIRTYIDLTIIFILNYEYGGIIWLYLLGLNQ
jgi:hypothetical protein